jgi:putative nucleotidyltransferase with HDIG domain
MSLTSTPSAPGQRLSLLQVYVQSVVAAGLGVIVFSLINLGRTPHPLAWLLFATLAMVTGTFTMKIASVSATISVADTFFITSAMLFGAAPATIIVALESLVVSWRRGHKWDRIAFNTAAPSLAIWVGARVFFWLAAGPPLAEADHPIATLVVPLLYMTAVFFLLNSGFIAVAVALQLQQSPLTIWRKHFSWLSVGFLAAGSLSFCLILLIQQVSLWAIALILPLILVFHLTLRSSFGRLEDAQKHLSDMDRLYLSTVETLAMAIDAKDDVTHSHVRRVQAYAVGLAKALGVSDELSLKAIEAAALLHDTGKLAVPEHILNKPGKLTASEFEKMKLHVDVGADILTLVDFPYPVVPIVRCHHESWDGSGYPRGVSGEDIPLGARILSVVDCFDALTSDRPYRARMSDEQAFEILRARRGTMYDPHVVDTFMRIQPEIAPKDAGGAPHEHVLRQISQSRVAEPARGEPQPAAVATVPSVTSAPNVPDEVLAFVSLSRLASGEHSVTDVLALASALLRGVTPAATAAWYLADPSRDELVVAHASGAGATQLRGMSMAIGERLTGWVAAHRQMVVNSDASLDLGSRMAIVPPLQSVLSVPLTVGDSLVGVLTLYSSQAQAFDDAHGRLVQMIAPHVADAIWRATCPAEKATPVNRDLRLVARSGQRSGTGH